ncbi:hypothetical protein M0P48_03860 [Candidatus Gracilibacteria bacterium]|nr:hypothetical protein [Candidatus Gracilibacteria bacterium]
MIPEVEEDSVGEGPDGGREKPLNEDSPEVDLGDGGFGVPEIGMDDEVGEIGCGIQTEVEVAQDLFEVVPFDPDALAREFLNDVRGMEAGHGPLNVDKSLVVEREERFRAFFSIGPQNRLGAKKSFEIYEKPLSFFERISPKVSEELSRLISENFSVAAIEEVLGPKLSEDLKNLGHDGKEARRQMVRDYIITYRDEKANPLTFTRVPAYGSSETGFDIETILKCPVSLNLNEAALREMFGNDPKEWVKKCLGFQLTSAVMAGSVLRDTRAEEGERKNEGTSLSVRYHAAYIMAQLSTYLEALIYKETGLSPAVSAIEEYAGGEGSDKKKKDLAKQYIYSMLTLLISDYSKLETPGARCEIAQEEFITAGLLELAKKYGIVRSDFGFDPKVSYHRELVGSGIGTEDQVHWQQVFDDLLLMRQIQYYQRVHLFSKSKHKEGRPSILDEILAVVNDKIQKGQTCKNGGVHVSMASLGNGNSLLERWLLQKGVVSKIVGVDVSDMAGTGDRTETNLIDNGERGMAMGKFIVVDVNKIDDKTPEGRKKLEDKVFGHFPRGVDLFTSFDSLHETPDPKRYLRRALCLVCPGGRVYVIDPTRSDALDMDRMTERFIQPYDSSAYPHSMTSIESLFEVVGLFSLRGATVQHFGVTPPIYAGYNDSLSRAVYSLKNPESENDVLHALPEEDVEWEKEIENDNDIFSVWPLSVVSEESRHKVLEVITGRVGGQIVDIKIKDEKSGEDRKIKMSEVKHIVLKWLIPEAEVKDKFSGRTWNEMEEDSVADAVSESAPYSKSIVKAYVDNFGPDSDFAKFNHYAGEARALIKALISIVGVEVADGVRKTSKGWSNYRF